MALINHLPKLKPLTIRTSLVCAATIFSLTLLPQGGVTAQSAAGPLPAASPSDTPAQAPAASSNAPAAKPNLAGTWKLNADQSDNPMDKMREAREESGVQPGAGRRGGFGGGGGGGYGRNGGGGMGGANRQRGAGMAQLVIGQTPTSARVTDASGRVIAQYEANPQPDNSGSANPGQNAPPVAQWQDSKLVTTLHMRNGGTTTRTYEMSPDNKQLIVTTKIETERLKEPVIVRQVYDPVTASTGGD
jgi:hypothetical protein